MAWDSLHGTKAVQRTKTLLVIVLLGGTITGSNAAEDDSEQLSTAEDPMTTTLSISDQTTIDQSNVTRITDNNTESDSSSTNNSVSRMMTVERLQMVKRVVVPTFLLVGLFGNTMTIIAMGHSLFRVTPIAIILVALSLSDSALLLMVPFDKLFVQKYLGFDVRVLHWFGCKTFFWFWRTAKMTSSWFVVLISLERFVVIIRPLKARTMVTKRTAVYGILLVCALSAVYNVGLARISDVIRNGRCEPGIPNIPAHRIIVRGLLFGALCLYTFIPIALVLFINIFPMFVLRRQLADKTAPPGDEEVNDVGGDTPDRLSSMLYGVIVIFSILMFPVAILHVIPEAHPSETSSMPLAIFRLSAETMEELNYSVHFYVYTICSCLFRERLRSLFGFSCCLARASRPLITIQRVDDPKQYKEVTAKVMESPIKEDPEEGGG
ncbi:hypothetical protein LSH36_1086g00017 [Paralvinella palmiformis]|uniref:G-protein coupled receptors family 1 profile domain-containing protein n=1 Tax=Paralvinella palmiformis TaxID=53620 RepID=A0AAD9MPU9_9ANNE|nr:hypothetical protein LSH36_1086g00017 [Paralvinella palmiformis]